jgi:hypothetical protein
MRTEPVNIIEKRKHQFQKWNRIVATLIVLFMMIFFFIKIVFL